MKTLFAIVCVTVSTVVQAKPVEIWDCQQFTDEIVVVATVEDGRLTGTIAVSGVTHKARFSVAGFDRRWDFGPKEDPHRYAFTIQPNGMALYYDFMTEKRAKPSRMMTCRQRPSQE